MVLAHAVNESDRVCIASVLLIVIS